MDPRSCLKSIKNKFQVVFYRNENHVYYFDHSSTRYLNLYGYGRSHPPTPTFLESKHQVRDVCFECKHSIYRTSRPSFADFPSSADLRKASYWPKELALDISKLSTKDLPRISVVNELTVPA